jgi:hypothetical protein
MAASEIIGERGDEERSYVRAHVPAIREQRHRMREQSGGDLNHHHHAGNGNHYPGAAFALGKITHEIMRMPEVGMIYTVHSDKIMRLLKVQLKTVGGCAVGIAAQRQRCRRC